LSPYILDLKDVVLYNKLYINNLSNFQFIIAIYVNTNYIFKDY